jgi:ABC-type methionine transport system ATPase subunit
MPTRKVLLKYPEHLIQEPVLFTMAKRFDVMPNIRRARVTDTVGEIALELEGTEESLAAGIRYLEERGVLVEPLEGDVVSP